MANRKSNIIRHSLSYLIRLSTAALPGILLLLSAAQVRAWDILMHAELAEIAHAALPSHIRVPLNPFLSDLISGAMAPDLVFQDLPNHFLNVHVAPNSSRRAQTRIEELYFDIARQLSTSTTDLSQVAFQMGRLAHYLADINQPLHTDERQGEALLHLKYESDAWARMYDLPLFDPGIRLRFNPSIAAWESAVQANRFYSATLAPYLEGRDMEGTFGVTGLNIQRAAEDIRDTWATLWELTRADAPRLYLSSEKLNYSPGESIRLALSMTAKKQMRNIRADLYLAAVSESGVISFLDAESGFVSNLVSYQKDIAITNRYMEVFDELIWPQTAHGKYRVYAVLAKPDSSPVNAENWLSNLARIDVRIQDIATIHLRDLLDEIYLFPAQMDSDEVVPLPLRRWDILFLGKSEIGSAGEDGGDRNNNPFPGNFNDIMVYLGRDTNGIPYAMEHTYSTTAEIVNLRLVRLPEFSRAETGSEALALPVVSKELWRYPVRWAKRLVLSELDKLNSNEGVLLETLEQNWRNGVSYQPEFFRSEDPNEKRILLVDDGLANGANGIDYWLSILEDVGNVCIRNSRIDAEALTDFYRYDPVSSSSLLSLEFNSDPLLVTAAALFAESGFYLNDPAPHIFRCDGSQETGLPIPGKLFDSPQLEEIPPDPEVTAWY